MPRKFKIPVFGLKIQERFWSLVEKTDGCWAWKGYTQEGRYGHFMVTPGHRQGAHRVAWQIAYGAIPDGLHVCHRCDNPSCVRPDHLFLGTHRDNMRDMVARGRNRRKVS